MSYGVEPVRGADGLWTLLPDTSDDAVDRGVLRWRAVAAGRRPHDHLARDLLFGSLGRDYRARLFHKLRKHPPEWIADAVERAARDGVAVPRQTLVNHLLLRQFHERHLAQLIRRSEESWHPPDHAVINELYACRPVGLLLEWAGDRPREHDYHCGWSRVCPWCHARKVVRLYRRLVAGPCDPANAGNKILLMAKARFDEPARPEDDPDYLTGDRVARVLGAWRPCLLALARKFGLTGGLVGYQVGPLRAFEGDELRPPLYSFRHELALLGEVTCEVDGPFDWGQFNRLWWRAGITAPRDRQPMLVDRRGVFGGVELPVEVTAVRMATPIALRWLLAGSPAHSRFGDERYVPLERNAAAFRYRGGWAVRRNLGVDGALALQPTFLFTADQFWSALDALRGRHLYAPFGSWAAALRKQPPRYGANLKAANRVRHDAAERARTPLKDAIRPVYESLERERNRPPGRALLQRELEARGVPVTERDVRWYLSVVSGSGARRPGG
jgi:hypothetical protein